jgi:phage tail P2-like protein
MPSGIRPYLEGDADRRLIPSSVRDERAIAFLQLVWGLLYFDTDKLELYNIDTVQSDVIPHLLQQFRLEGFLPDNLPEDRRRALLKRAIEIWRYIGTRYGIELVVEISLNIKIGFVEWWELNTTPHTFVVTLSIDDSQQTYLGDLGTALQTRVIAIINASKPPRSHLLRLDLSLDAEARQRIAVVRNNHELIMNFDVWRSVDGRSRPAIAAVSGGFELIAR